MGFESNRTVRSRSTEKVPTSYTPPASGPKLQGFDVGQYVDAQRAPTPPSSPVAPPMSAPPPVADRQVMSGPVVSGNAMLDLSPGWANRVRAGANGGQAWHEPRAARNRGNQAVVKGVGDVIALLKSYNR